MVDRSEDVLEAGFVDEYKCGMQFFSSHHVELNMNIFILEKVLALRHRISALFQALAINATYRMLPIGYDTDISQSDIEQLLDDFADKSRILRMPEQQLRFWQTYRLPTLIDAEKEQFNTYQRKFGLTPI